MFPRPGTGWDLRIQNKSENLWKYVKGIESLQPGLVSSSIHLLTVILTVIPETVAETSTQETKHHTQRVGELRFIMPAGPEELTLQALSLK